MPSLLYLALSNAVLATLLAALVAVVSRFCRRPSVRHALWLLVLLKLITPTLVPLSVTWPRSEENEPQTAEPASSDLILPDSFADAANGRRQPAGEELDQPAEETLYQPGDAGRSPHSYWMPLLCMTWLGGALIWWTVAAVRLWRFRRLLRQARPGAVDVQAQGRRIAATLGLRHCPPVLFLSAPLSPMLWALGVSPRLLMPAVLWHKLASEQQDTLLAHELAHLRRGDHWVRRLELLVLGLYWWHPVVWWAQRRLQEAEEECCDALVVAILPDAAPAYASALVETVAFLSQSRSAALVGASGAGQVPLLKRRLTMILTESPFRKPSRIGFWIVIGMGALLLPLAPQAARTEALEEPQGEKTKNEPFSLDFGFPLARLADSPHKNQVESCTACHAVSMPKSDFHGKPQSWREAHDEIVRLMDELRRRQAQFHTTLNPLPPAAEPDRSKEIEKLQDEIELLKVQVRLKEAHVAATQATLKEYKKRSATYAEVNRRQPGAISTDTILETQIAVTTHEGQLQVHGVELQEVLVRLKQAERRLARLQPPQPRTDQPAVPARPQSPERLRELEKKLDELRKEMDNLRREKRPEESSDPEQEYRKLRGFITFVWPTLDSTRLEENIPKAQKAFQMCKAAGDHSSLQKLLKGTEEHVLRLQKESTKLRPDLIIDDEREAKKLKKVAEQIVKLGQEIKEYLMPGPLGR